MVNKKLHMVIRAIGPRETETTDPEVGLYLLGLREHIHPNDTQHCIYKTRIGAYISSALNLVIYRHGILAWAHKIPGVGWMSSISLIPALRRYDVPITPVDAAYTMRDSRSRTQRLQ